MSLLARIISGINGPVNRIGSFLSAPVAALPGWLSNTLIAAVVGVLLLLVFKYTSNQKAIGRVRDHIKADMLALKLFKDSMSVTLQSLGRVFKGALLLLFYAMKPMLVMMVPVVLLLSQMNLWYQYRPLKTGEKTLVTMKLNGNGNESFPEVHLQPDPAIENIVGPVRVLGRREILWKIRAKNPGIHHIVFQSGDEQVLKELAVGNGYMRVSRKRPGWHWMDILAHPLEPPFKKDAVVRSIRIDFPERDSKTSGTDWWVIYFFGVSVVFAFISKPVFKVRI